MGTDKLRFVGKVQDGASGFRRLQLPGCSGDCQLVPDWPEDLYRGSLNVQIDTNGYPKKFVEVFGDTQMRNLDSRKFLPAAELDYDVIPNNSLPPERNRPPDRGRPQIWRATLRNLATGDTALCWVLRRRHSTMRQDTLECVAGVRLRDALTLETGDAVELVVEGTWA